MKLLSITLLAFSLTANSLRAEDPDAHAKEYIALMNEVSHRVAMGEINALDDLKKLPADYGEAAVLQQFKNYYNLYKARPSDDATALKAAQVATEIPGGEAYLRTLLVKLEKPTGGIINQRNNAINALVLARNNVSVRLFCGVLSDPDLGVRPDLICRCLAKMNIADAPYNDKTIADSISPEGIAKWKEWWTANKAKFAK